MLDHVTKSSGEIAHPRPNVIICEIDNLPQRNNLVK